MSQNHDVNQTMFINQLKFSYSFPGLVLSCPDFFLTFPYLSCFSLWREFFSVCCSSLSCFSIQLAWSCIFQAARPCTPFNSEKLVRVSKYYWPGDLRGVCLARRICRRLNNSCRKTGGAIRGRRNGPTTGTRCPLPLIRVTGIDWMVLHQLVSCLSGE